MNSAVIDTTTRQWNADLRSQASKARTPIAATLELTRQCSFQCAHCYLGGQAAQRALATKERGAEAIKQSMREWVDAGCLYLTLTGGDPMLRPDFAEVYRHARELGMVVSVFCTGTQVTPEIVSLFCELPPRKVEISLYGSTPGTMARVTGVPDAHDRVWRGIRMLHEAGISLGLKTLLLTTNLHEFEAMEAQAAERGIPFRHDAALFPCLADGSTVPLAFRVAPEEAVCRDLATPERRRIWREKIEKTAEAPVSDRLYSCSAGLTSFHADPFGGLYPCLMASRYRVEAGDHSFHEVWENDLSAIRHRKRSCSGGSFSGPQRGACTHCPAFNQLETGDEELESDYMKTITRLRYEQTMCEEDGGPS